jgi:hypothetical protein
MSRLDAVVHLLSIDRRIGGGYLRTFALAAVLTVAGAAAMNYLVDPFQFFRKSAHPQFAILMMRHQMPAIIRNYPFDAAVIGNSLAANLRPAMFAKYDPPLQMQNLSMLAATLNEAAIIADLALRARPLKRLYWGIGYQAVDGYKFPDFPQCMYSRIFEHLPYCYFWNIDVLRETAAKLIGYPSLSRAGWLDHLDGWQSYGDLPMDLHEHVCTMQGLIGSRDRIEAMTQFAVRRLDASPATLEGVLATSLVVPLVESHPDVRFVFFIPPIFITEFWRQTYGGNLVSYPYITQELLKHSNVELFDFQPASAVTHDPALFRDLIHAQGGTAGKMADWMLDGKDRYRVIDAAADRQALQDELRSGAKLLSAYFDERCDQGK